MLVEELKHIKSGAKELKEFGLVVGCGLIVVGGCLWHFKDTFFLPFAYIGTTLIALAFVCRKVLWAPQKIWMGLGLCMGWVVGHVLMSLVFFIGVIPIGIAVKLSGRRLLDEKLNSGVESYWNKRDMDKADHKNCEKQY
ncbi:MAG: hypothetical protein ACI9CF_000048 [Candidatus Omnitrophota bacterium]|jgi:hypothetical protein